jgi:hypothetical protein
MNDEKLIRNRFKLEGSAIDPIARIYVNGRRTNAFIEIDCERPNQNHVPTEIVWEAVKRYKADLEQPF